MQASKTQKKRKKKVTDQTDEKMRRVENSLKKKICRKVYSSRRVVVGVVERILAAGIAGLFRDPPLRQHRALPPRAS